MALSAVDLYERLKPHLGEGETKALIEYVDGKIRGEVATKEDLLLVKGDLEAKIQEVREDLHGVREELLGKIQEVREELLGKIQEVREELLGKIQGVKDELKAEIQGVRDEIWKLRVLVVVVLVVVIVLNPKVLELVGRILGVAK